MQYQNLELKNQLQELIKNQVQKFDTNLTLEIILIGDDFVCKKYTNLKQSVGKKLGIEVIIHTFDNDIKELEIQELINKIEINKNGLIFQLPVPQNLVKFVNQTPQNSDVDLLGSSADKLWKLGFLPPTIGAIDLVLKQILNNQKNSDFTALIDQKLNLKGKLVGVIGQGVLVGKPLLRYLAVREASIISINKDTSNPELLTQKCDILICAAGVPNLVKQSWLNPNTIIIDAATSESSGVLVGDVDRDSIYESNILVASPSGVGGLTVLYLFYNLLKLASK